VNIPETLYVVFSLDGDILTVTDDEKGAMADSGYIDDSLLIPYTAGDGEDKEI
jgi:hypothetical protein